ncbi:MAG: FumA C-terminus/TtdB family hydratase beta subunit [Syntrophales bacterium]|nr:FumA C-terminus/TtdB family hydratase beta subunit [Syntrophales bacterium]
MKKVTLPTDEKSVKSLEVGDYVLLSGLIITARDRAHKWMYENFVNQEKIPTAEDVMVYERLKTLLADGAIYHCGPIIKENQSGWEIISAGPTTSEREEPYEAAIMRHFRVRVVLGKGGMGENTRKACQEVPAVYLHAVGGAAVVAAKRVKRVVEVLKPEFGMPESIWVLEIQDFPCVVTMDAWGFNLHEEVLRRSEGLFQHMISL